MSNGSPPNRTEQDLNAIQGRSRICKGLKKMYEHIVKRFWEKAHIMGNVIQKWASKALALFVALSLILGLTPTADLAFAAPGEGASEPGIEEGGGAGSEPGNGSEGDSGDVPGIDVPEGGSSEIAEGSYVSEGVGKTDAKNAVESLIDVDINNMFKLTLTTSNLEDPLILEIPSAVDMENNEYLITAQIEDGVPFGKVPPVDGSNTPDEGDTTEPDEGDENGGSSLPEGGNTGDTTDPSDTPSTEDPSFPYYNFTLAREVMQGTPDAADSPFLVSGVVEADADGKATYTHRVTSADVLNEESVYKYIYTVTDGVGNTRTASVEVSYASSYQTMWIYDTDTTKRGTSAYGKFYKGEATELYAPEVASPVKTIIQNGVHGQRILSTYDLSITNALADEDHPTYLGDIRAFRFTLNDIPNGMQLHKMTDSGTLVQLVEGTDYVIDSATKTVTVYNTDSAWVYAFTLPVAESHLITVTSSVSENAGGTITPLGTIKYAQGEVGRYVLVPNTADLSVSDSKSYSIDYLELDGARVNLTGDNFFDLDTSSMREGSTHTLVAHFKENPTRPDPENPYLFKHEITTELAGDGLGWIGFEYDTKVDGEVVHVSHGSETDTHPIDLSVPEGADVTFTFHPLEGYALKSVEIKRGDADVWTPLEVKTAGNMFVETFLKQSIAIRATFVESSQEFIPNVGVSFEIEPEGTGHTVSATSVAYGKPYTFQALPNALWGLADIYYTYNAEKENPTRYELAHTGANSYTVNNVLGEITVHVTFEYLPRSVSFDIQGEGLATAVYTRIQEVEGASVTDITTKIVEGEVDITDVLARTNFEFTVLPYKFNKLNRVSLLVGTDRQTLEPDERGVYAIPSEVIDQSPFIQITFVSDNTPRNEVTVSMNINVNVGYNHATGTEGTLVSRDDIEIFPKPPVQVAYDSDESQAFYLLPPEGYIIRTLKGHIRGRDIDLSYKSLSSNDSRNNVREMLENITAAQAAKNAIAQASLSDVSDDGTGMIPAARTFRSLGATPTQQSYTAADSNRAASTPQGVRYYMFELSHLTDDIDVEVEFWPIDEANGVYDDAVSDGTIPSANKVTMTILADTEGGTPVPSGEQTFFEGFEYPFEFVPYEGYKVGYVIIEDADGTRQLFSDFDDGVITIPIAFKEGRRILAGFELSETATGSPTFYYVDVQAEEGGTVTPTGLQRVRKGSTLRVFCVPDEGYEFDTFHIEGPIEQLEDSSELSRAAINTGTEFRVAGSKGSTIRALFKKADPVTVTSRTTEHGSIDPEGTFELEIGSQLTFTLTPDAGYAGYLVIEDEEGKRQVSLDSNSYTYDVVSDATIEAHFAPANIPGFANGSLRELKRLQSLAKTGDMNGPAIAVLTVVAIGCAVCAYICMRRPRKDTNVRSGFGMKR